MLGRHMNKSTKENIQLLYMRLLEIKMTMSDENKI